MIGLSAAGQAAFDANTRKLYIAAAINLNSRFLDDSISVEVLSGGDYFNTANQVYNDRTAAPFKRIHFGESGFSDGHGLIDATVECGWTSEEISGAGGSFAVSPSIEETFAARTVYNIRVYGDDAWNDYPVDFTVELYYNGSYHTEINVTGNDNVDYFYELPVIRTGVTKAKLTISKWSEETRPSKIYSFLVGHLILLEREDVYSLYVLEEDSYQSGSLPVGKISSNQLTMVFYDDGSISTLELRRNKLASISLIAENNGIFYPVDMGQYYIKEWQPDSLNKTLSIIAMDMLSITAEDEYYATVTKATDAYSVLENIMAASRIPSSMYTIDDEFRNFDIPVALFEPMNQQAAIGKVMEMTLGSCYTDRAVGRLRFIGPTASESDGVSQKTFTNLTHVMEGTYEPIELNEIATVFEVKYYEIIIADTPENVIESTEEITIEAGLTEEIILDFPSDYISVDEVSIPTIAPTGSGLTITDWTAYIDYISITVKNSSSNAQAITSITVSGKPVTKIVHAYRTENAEAVEAFGRIPYTMDNILVQSYARAKAIGDALKAKYSNPGGKIVNNLWGAPYWTIGDTGTFPDKDQSNQKAQTKRQEFYLDESGFRQITTSEKVS